MKNYRYEQTRVIEKKTGFVVKVAKSKTEAKNITTKLNSGCGFNGDTPMFFINKKDQECHART